MAKFDPRTFKPEPDTYVVITKLDAAIRQLHAAIKLWFEDGDPVSIHSLFSAARGILAPIVESRGTWQGTFDTTNIRAGLEKEYLAVMKVHANFFKHGGRDPDDSIKFNPEANISELRVAVEVLLQIDRAVRSPLIAAFCVRFALEKPEILSPDAVYPQVDATFQVELRSLPRNEFLSHLGGLLGVTNWTKPITSP